MRNLFGACDDYHKKAQSDRFCDSSHSLKATCGVVTCARHRTITCSGRWSPEFGTSWGTAASATRSGPFVCCPSLPYMRFDRKSHKRIFTGSSHSYLASCATPEIVWPVSAERYHLRTSRRTSDLPPIRSRCAAVLDRCRQAEKWVRTPLKQVIDHIAPRLLVACTPKQKQTLRRCEFLCELYHLHWLRLAHLQ
jgi:hypothetical protein